MSTTASDYKAIAASLPVGPDGRHHVVGLSGGKDSCALALRLRECHPDIPYIFLCTPTGDELPEMLAHWDRLEELLGQPLVRITNRTLDEWIEHFKMLPSGTARWCTRLLKIEPCLTLLALLNDPVLYVGLRADEEERQGIYSDKVETRFPLREWGWGLDEVWAFLDERGVSIPKRTDCARCYDQRLSEWKDLWENHPDLYADAEAQEAWVSTERGRDFTFRSRTRDTWPAGLKPLREKWEAGHWLQGEAKRRQQSLFVIDDDRGDACRVCRL